MPRLEQFAERLDRTMARLTVERLAEQQERAHEMELSDADVQRFTVLADAIHHLEVRPRLEALVRHFPNASVEHWSSASGIHSHCDFARTAQYPASVRLTIGIALDRRTRRTSLQYKFSIVPLLFQFDAADELVLDLSAPDMAEIVDWIENKIQLFLETYLGIESDPNYQRENQHIDPVCGMHVQAGRTAYTTVHAHHHYYFCSRECLERFTSWPDFFAGNAVQPLARAETHETSDPQRTSAAVGTATPDGR